MERETWIDDLKRNEI